MELCVLIALGSLCVSCFSLAACIGLRLRVSELDDRSDLAFENDIHLLSIYQQIEKRVNALSDGE